MDWVTTWYTTTAGIAVAAIFFVNVAKKLLINVSYVNKIPTWVFCTLVAFVLTYFANQQWHTLPGDSWLILAMQSVVSAGLASGFWEWYNNTTTTLRETAIKSGINPA